MHDQATSCGMVRCNKEKFYAQTTIEFQVLGPVYQRSYTGTPREAEYSAYVRNKQPVNLRLDGMLLHECWYRAYIRNLPA